ncbi:hypothetical protein ACF0H5_005289 [Mactra antiquata]
MITMKNMNSCKRVSFGSKGSMVETLIIEDIPYVVDDSVYTNHLYSNKIAVFPITRELDECQGKHLKDFRKGPVLSS